VSHLFRWSSRVSGQRHGQRRGEQHQSQRARSQVVEIVLQPGAVYDRVVNHWDDAGCGEAICNRLTFVVSHRCRHQIDLARATAGRTLLTIPRASPPPPDSVLKAFNATGSRKPLPGGQGRSWRVADIVFKPLDLFPESVEWQARILPQVSGRDVRVAPPLRSDDGRVVVDGWTAWTHVDGQHFQRRWPEIIAAGVHFHRAVSNLDRPQFISRYNDPWATGDRVAWGEHSLIEFQAVPHIARLSDHLRPVEAQSQVIHGDLTGNVLFSDSLPPAVIDLAIYWRPPQFATAVVVGDALTWEGADETLLSVVADIRDFPQYLLRAIIYRIVTAALFRMEQTLESEFARAVEIACALAARAR
jgi:uncharacterized protein (TIGR02569 family)